MQFNEVMGIKAIGQTGVIKSLFQITKQNTEKQQVFGWALVSHSWELGTDGVYTLKQLVDHQGDMVEEDALEQMAYTFVMKYREAGELHERGGCGTCIESAALTLEKQTAMGITKGSCPVGWWLGFQITDNIVWQGIKDGTYKDFSIEGTGLREDVIISDDDIGNYDVAKV